MMKKILLVSFALLSPLAAQDEAAKAKAQELIKIMEIDKNIDASMVQILNMMDGMVDSQGLSEEQAALAKKSARVATEASFKSMKAMDLEKIFGEIYAEVFTAEEIQGIIDFYQSPVGKKFLEKQPQLTAATMKKMQTMMARIMPDIQDAVEKSILEAKENE